MNILLIGEGGREHTLAWKLSQSPKCDNLYIAPGNAGTAQLGTNLACSPTDFPALKDFVSDLEIDLIVVGPEQPLVVGIVDYFQSRGIPVIGPNREAAQLEGSKAFSKSFMLKYGIPTARYASFESNQLGEALNYIKEHPLPIVVKASGLAAGKGVIICDTHTQAAEVATKMLSGEAFGSSGKNIVIEEFLKGIEISVFVLTDGKNYVLLPSAKDYKRIGEGDTGPNTGGMGAISPVPFANDIFLREVREQIIEPTLYGIQEEELDYKGFIFFGLMVVEGRPYLLEYNVRLGDPETEVIMPRIKNDLVDILVATYEGRLSSVQLDVLPEACATVMLVSGGYPGSYEKAKPITGLQEVKGSWVFHAGTLQQNDKVLTNGGRVLAVSSLAKDIPSALAQSLHNAGKIHFEGVYYRKDIGFDIRA